MLFRSRREPWHQTMQPRHGGWPTRPGRRPCCWNGWPASTSATGGNRPVALGCSTLDRPSHAPAQASMPGEACGGQGSWRRHRPARGRSKPSTRSQDRSRVPWYPCDACLATNSFPSGRPMPHSHFSSLAVVKGVMSGKPSQPSSRNRQPGLVHSAPDMARMAGAQSTRPPAPHVSAPVPSTMHKVNLRP